MEKRKGKELEDRLIDFSTKVIIITEELPKTVFGLYLASQLTRSGASPALNYGEAQGVESRKDFIHKMKVCLKELRETHNSLRLAKNYLARKEMSTEKVEGSLEEVNELIPIFIVSVQTAQKNLIENK